MGDNLYKISNMFLGDEKTTTVKIADGEGILGKYKEHMESGKYLTIAFDRVDQSGNLTTVDKNVTLCMYAEEINGKRYDLRYKSQKLADTYLVKVTDIDQQNKIVYLSHNAARIENRPSIEEEIDRRLQKNAQVRIKGKVIRVQSRISDGETVDTGVWLDLCGVGLLGFVYIGNWNATFTPALRGKVSYGDVIEVIVLDKATRRGLGGEESVSYYNCSRKELVQDPWEDKTLGERYHQEDIVRIRCLTKHENHWFGELNGLEDIQVFAEYPSRDHNFPIIEGMEYMGKIYAMNIPERTLKVRVFKALTLDNMKNTYEKENAENERTAGEGSQGNRVPDEL